MSVNNNLQDNLTSSFPVHISSISCSCLIPLGKVLITLLNRSGDIRHPFLVSDFKEKTFNSSLK